MSLNRIIPLLLLDEKKLVKTKMFSSPSYIGDPKNTIKLFNEMNCSEIIMIDIGLNKKNEKINLNFLENVVSEAFMPVSYGGGIQNLNNINDLIKIGCEKISINHLSNNKGFVKEAINEFGSSTIIVSIDIVKKNNDLICYDYYTNEITSITLKEKLKILNELNVGEYLINFKDRDGTMSGYDRDAIIEILKMTSSQITFCGGASSYKDILNTFKTGAKSLAAGSLFVYQSLDSGVLVNYPDDKELEEMLKI